MRTRVPVEPLKGKKSAAKSISLSPELLMWVDAQADEAGRNRSSWIAWALERLRQNKPVPLEDVEAKLAKAEAERGQAHAEPTPTTTGAVANAKNIKEAVEKRRERLAKKPRKGHQGKTPSH